MANATAAAHSPADLREWSVAHFLFHDPRAAWLWLVVRLYLGYEWIDAGWSKLTDPQGQWIGANAGKALAGFANAAIPKATGAHPAVQDWYATFLKDVVVPNAPAFAYVVAFGETLVGLGLILGALTGIAAFFGIVMNANYLLAGAVSTNPILAILAVFVVLAWRNAGWIGVDRFLLPALGTPWQPGDIFRHGVSASSA
jgi:thiosulfate dehydrogenase (quinone) large subunit